MKAREPKDVVVVKVLIPDLHSSPPTRVEHPLCCLSNGLSNLELHKSTFCSFALHQLRRHYKLIYHCVYHMKFTISYNSPKTTKDTHRSLEAQVLYFHRAIRKFCHFLTEEKKDKKKEKPDAFFGLVAIYGNLVTTQYSNNAMPLNKNLHFLVKTKVKQCHNSCHAIVAHENTRTLHFSEAAAICILL